MNNTAPAHRFSLGIAALVLFSIPAIAEEERSLFDGKSLAGWKAAENSDSFHVVDGAIVASGPRAHLFYVGEEGAADFTDFELTAEVKAKAGANSGIFFHTAWQPSGWPHPGIRGPGR
jgi:Domain of Unknown Function (DUF1080)